MYYRIISTFLFFFISIVCLAQQNLIIRGKTNGFSDGTKILITAQTPFNSVFTYNNIIDTATIINHEFSFNLKADYAEPYILSILNKEVWIRIFLQPGKANIVLKDSLLKNITITNNKAALDYIFFDKKINTIKKTDRLKSLLNKYDDVYAINPLLSKSILDTIRFIKDSLDKCRAKIALEWVSRNPLSLINSYAIYFYLKGHLPVKQMKNLFYKSAIANRNNSWGKELVYFFENFNNIEIGKKLPIFPLFDTTNSKILLSEFEGKYILLDFWASWCFPCREKIPELLNINNFYKNKNFDIIGVSLDDNKKAWIDAILKGKSTWLQVSNLQNGSNKIAINYDISLIPYNLLVDPKGVIVAKNIWGEQLNKLLNSLLK